MLENQNNAGDGQTAPEYQRTYATSGTKKRKATLRLKPTGHLPSAQTESSGDGHDAVDSQVTHAAPDDPIACLRSLQAQRVAVIRARTRISNACGGRVRTLLGWRFDMSEAEQKKIKAAASAIIKAIRACEPVEDEHAEVARASMAWVLACQDAAKPFDKMLKGIEAEMTGLAMALPVWPWVEAVKGAGAIGLATIVGEAGSLGDYPNPGKLWKRLGLAPKGCYSITCKDGTEANAIPRRRRSAVWVIADSLLRAKNDYQKLYRERKEYECQQHPEFFKSRDEDGKIHVTKHCDVRSRRYAEKRFILDLWIAWRKAW